MDAELIRLSRFRLFRLAHHVNLVAVLFSHGDNLMTRFCTEMRHVDHRRRVICQHLNTSACCQRGHPLAQFQNGQGAQQPTRIQCIDNLHVTRFRSSVTACPQGCDIACRDAARQMDYLGFMFGIEIIDAGLLPAMIVALLAGVISFLSPCVLPIVPPYIAYMSGVTLTELSQEGQKRARAILPALFFVLGLSTVFLFLGFTASAIGQTFLQYQDTFNTVAGLLVMGFGAHFVGVYRIGFLDREARLDVGDKGGSSFGAYVLGLAFAFGWTPCIGPQLGAILSMAASEGNVTRGTLLLAVYAMGLGVPFLLVAAFLPRLTGLMGWMKRHMEQIERVMGLLLWTIGLLMLTGGFSDFSFWLLETFPSLAALG